MAAYRAIKHSRHFLEGRSFTIFTDHKALISAYASSRTNYTPREVRHHAYLAEFSTDIQHVSGSVNIPGDALSRLAAVSSSDVSLEKLAKQQKGDQELQTLQSSSTAFYFPNHNVEVTCNISTSRQRPFVPLGLRCQAFVSLHSLAHPGIKASQKLVSALCLAGNEHRRKAVVKILPELPTYKDRPIHKCALGKVPSS